MRAQLASRYLLGKCLVHPGRLHIRLAILFAVAGKELTQVKRGDLIIRANVVNADRVRSGLLTADMIAARSTARGLSEKDYMSGNLLGREVTADHPHLLDDLQVQGDRILGVEIEDHVLLS
jgi:hypothetical protein